MACLKYHATFAWRDREKPMKICQASWCRDRFTPGITIWTSPFSRFVYYPSPLPEQVPYSYPSLPQYVHTLALTTIHCRYIYYMPTSHHTHSSIYPQSPSSTKVHLCWCKCSVKSQMIGLTSQWRPNVTTLLMTVLSLLKCLYKIGQSSSYHPATIWVSVLCP